MWWFIIWKTDLRTHILFMPIPDEWRWLLINSISGCIYIVEICLKTWEHRIWNLRMCRIVVKNSGKNIRLLSLTQTSIWQMPVLWVIHPLPRICQCCKLLSTLWKWWEIVSEDNITGRFRRGISVQLMGWQKRTRLRLWRRILLNIISIVFMR